MTISPVLRVVVFLSALCAAAPTLSFPINSQVPPVARVGQPFSFVFSSSTFSPSGQLTYTLANAPAWLSIDSESRRIYGTPEEADVAPGDVVGVQFELVAADDSGSTSLDATLVVSRNPSPSVALPLSRQIPEFGSFSQPSSIVMGPQQAFTLNFAPDTFSNPMGKGLSYYAVMEDNTPLPSWVSFDSGKLSFLGTTPALGTLMQIPQSFSFRFVASDVVGFSAASLPFSIVIGNHRITADSSFIVLGATAGTPLSYTELQSDIKFDGQDVKSGNVSVISTPNIPPWLSVDKDTWEISGTPPATAKSSNFTIMLADTFSNTLNLTVSLNITNGLFKGSLPEMRITAGKNFEFDLGPYLSNPSDAELRIDVAPLSTWIQFDSTRKTIFGDAPEKLSTSPITIEVHAKSRSSGLEFSQALPVRIQAANHRSTSSASTSGSTPASTSSPSADPDSGARRKASLKQILMATLIPIFFLLFVLACVILCCIRRRRRQSTGDSSRNISWPLCGSLATRIRTKGKDSFQSLIGRRGVDKSSPRNRKSRQKSYAEAAIGSLKGFETDPETHPLLRSDSWLAVVARKIFIKRPGKGYPTRTAFHEEKRGGVLEANSLPAPRNDNRSLSRDTFEADIPTPDTSIPTTPDFVYSNRHNLETNSETWGSYRTTDYDEFTTVGSSAHTSILNLARPSENHAPQSLVKTSTTRAWAAGNVSRFVERFRKKKEAGVKTPERGVAANLQISAPLVPPRPVLDDRPVTRRGPDPGTYATKRERSRDEEGSPPNMTPAMAVGPRANPRKLSQEAAQEQVACDPLGIPCDHTAAPPPTVPSRTWSTVYSAIRDETKTPEQGGRSAGGKSKTTSLPPGMSYSSTASSPQPNWAIIRESPNPSIWMDDVSVRTDNTRWPQRPRTTIEPLSEASDTAPDFGSRPPSRHRGLLGTAGSRHSRRPSSRFAGMGTHSGPSSAGGLGRERTVGSATTGSEDDYMVFI